ncbi:MAG: hypothetical protein KBA51_03340 [Kiritimatiellae bacterium]|nr:hypothetical protein [Kiritimatiellia bacterium]
MKTHWLAWTVAVLAVTIGPRAVETAWKPSALSFRNDGEPEYGRLFSPTHPADSQADVPKTRTVAQPREQALEEEVVQARAERDDIRNWVIQTLWGRVAIPSELVSTLDAPATDDAFQLHPVMGQLIRATASEAEAISLALAAAMSEAREVWGRQTRVVSSSLDEWVVMIPPHEIEGEAIRQRLSDAVTAAVGSARAGLFWRAASRDLERSFVHFGLGARVIRCTDLDGESGRSGVRIRDELVTADETGLRRIEAIEWEADAVPEAYTYFERLARAPSVPL